MLNNKKIIISCSAAGSLVNFRGKLIQELVKNNQVAVFSPLISDFRLKKRLNELGVTVYESSLVRNSVSIWSDFSYMMELRKLIKTIKPDIFFSYTFKPVIFGSMVASFYRVKGIVAMLTGLGYSFSDQAKTNLLSRITHRLLKYSLKNKQVKIVFQNEDDYNELMTLNIINKENKSFIVNGSGVDLSEYNYAEANTNSITFLMMSRLINAKGIREYYEAAKITKAKYPHVTFKLIGSYDRGVDAIEEELYEKIKSNTVIEYSGWVSHVKPFIQAASVVVLPSYYREGIPRSVQEGMAIGRAIITTDHVGCKETVNVNPEKQNGLLVPIKNVDALSLAMEYYIQNPQEIVRHGKNGRSYAEEKFDVNKINKNMLEILETN